MKRRINQTALLKIPLLLFLFFLFSSNILNAQSKKIITGVVIDNETKLSIPGATIKVRGAATSVTTNEKGSFRIQVTNNDVLVIGYVGYRSREIPIGSSTTMNVALSPSANSLNEVVVIGYGAVAKSDLTGSVAQVSIQDLEKAPVGSFSEALAGRVAGVAVSATDGQPGTTPQIVIRGGGSLTQSNAPLYVIDGFPIEDLDPSTINNDDIESINILKDASATAIYGARGSNGVIIIETKKGKIGKPVITLNGSYGFQRPNKFVEMMNPYEFVKYSAELKPDITAEYYFDADKTLESYQGVKGVDWQRLIMEDNPMQIYNLAVRGGSEQTQYSLSGSYYDQNGVVLNTNAKRFQGRVSLDQTFSKKFKAGITANFSANTSSGIPVSQAAGGNTTSHIFYNMWAFRPISGLSNLDLTLVEDDPDVAANETRFNPVVTAENTDRNQYTKTLTGTGYLSYNIVKGLTFKVTGSANNSAYKTDQFYNSKTPQAHPRSISAIRGIFGSINYLDVTTLSNENILTFTKTFKKVHAVTALGGFSTQLRSLNSQGIGVGSLPNEELGLGGFSSGKPYTNPAARSVSSMASFFGRINYNYKWKYFLTGTFRADGSSKFPEQNRFGYFPSAAFSWNMMKEPFMKGLPAVSTSKFRASYGVTGNNRVGDFDYLNKLTQPIANSYSFGNAEPGLGSVLTNLGNQKLKWETAHQIDLGYDLGLFNNRLDFTVDVYRKTTKDLLLNANLPYTTGLSNVYQNIGSVSNEGIELSLNTINVQNKNFTWQSNFNISFNRNKVLALASGEQKRFSNISFESLYADPLYLAEVGKPAAMFYGYIFDGVYQYADFDSPAPGSYQLKANLPTNGNARGVIQPGDIKYRDINGDGVVNANDLSIIGHALPVHTGGFSNNFKYKQFDLNVFLQWSYGNEIYNANRMVLEGNGLARTFVNQYASYADRWSPENPTNRNYRSGGQGPIGRFSSRMLEDGSYLRLKTLSIGYNVPAKLLKHIDMTGLRFTVAAQNLITWTNYSGLDPEVSVRNTILTPGFDYSAYPQAQTIVFGINAKF